MRKQLFTYYLISTVCYLITFGCSDFAVGEEFLEKAPGGDITIDTIFSSKVYAERALNSAYATLRCGFPMHNAAYTSSSYEYVYPGDKLGNDNLDALTDIINSHCNWGGVYDVYYSGKYNAEIENGGFGSQSTKLGFLPWQDATWVGIRKAYLFINNVDRVPDMTDDEKKRRKAEAKMVIACQYHELMRHFGGIPLLTTDIKADNQQEADYSRQTLETTVNFIASLCDEAAQDLPWTVVPADDGRFTKAGAMALKARVLLIAASPIFNANTPYETMPPLTVGNVGKISEDDIPKMVWYGDYAQGRWDEVAKACAEFIRENEKNGNAYRLVEASAPDMDGYRDAFSRSYSERHNGEILIATGRTKRTYGDLYLGYYFGPADDINGNQGRGYGGGCVTLNFVDKFTYSNGEKASYRQWIKDNGPIGTLNDNPFINRDPRLYETVMIVGDRFRGRVAEMWVGGRERHEAEHPRANTGFCVRKYLWDYNEATFHNKPSNYSYIRLPEIYLTYAEALNELGRETEAIEWLNKVRNRVGLPDMNSNLLQRLHQEKELPDYPESQLMGNKMLREEILDERAREFCFEEIRWFDMIRWKRKDIFQQELYGITILLESGSVEGGDIKFNFSEPRLEPPRFWQVRFSPKWYLSAFPSNEINKGYGLIQNPGW